MRKRDARRWSNCDTIKFSNLKFEVSNLKSTMLTFANFFTGGQFIGVGILLVIISVLLRRSITRSKSRQPRDVVREVHDDFRKAESTYSGRLNALIRRRFRLALSNHQLAFCILHSPFCI